MITTVSFGETGQVECTYKKSLDMVSLTITEDDGSVYLVLNKNFASKIYEALQKALTSGE